MVTAAACAVQPPDLPISMPLRQCLKHGEDGGDTDPGADQQLGRMRSVEHEAATWCCDVELVADGQPGMQIAAGGTIVFALDRDPVVPESGGPDIE
jgi:hypothetical protein